MKKILLIILFLSMGVFVFAQNTGISSVLNTVSEGVFTNELDAAVSVEGLLSSGPGFRDLTHDYLFAGLTNLELIALQSTSGFTISSPLWAGFYKAGDKPWSAFGAFMADSPTGNQTGGTMYTQGTPVTVTSGSNTTTYQWNNLSSTVKYTANRIANALRLSGQYLFTMGDMNSGVFIDVNLSDSDPQNLNYVGTDVHYYNSATTGAPAPVEDYTYARTRTSRNNTSAFTVAVPLFIPGTDSSQMFNIKTKFDITDNSNSYSDSYSGSPHTAILTTTTTVANDATRRSLAGELVGDYTLKKRGIWGNNPKDQLWIKGTADVTLNGGTYSISHITQNISAAGGGAAIVSGTRHDQEITTDGIFGITGKVRGGAGHSFYFDLGSGVEFGLKPEVGLEYNLVLPVSVKNKTTVTSTDGNGDGDFSDAADTIQTQTVTYTNSSIVPLTGTISSTVMINAVSCSIGLPLAVTFTPPKWPITFTLGSKPSIGSEMVFTNTKTSTSSTVTSAVDGTGAASGVTTTVNAVTANETSVMTTVYSVSATHNIGFSMKINDSFRLDVNLDSSTSASDVFDFRDLTAQAIIALP